MPLRWRGSPLLRCHRCFAAPASCPPQLAAAHGRYSALLCIHVCCRLGYERTDRTLWSTVGFPSRRLPGSSGRAVAETVRQVAAARLASEPTIAAVVEGIRKKYAVVQQPDPKELPVDWHKLASLSPLVALALIPASLAGGLVGCWWACKLLLRHVRQQFGVMGALLLAWPLAGCWLWLLLVAVSAAELSGGLLDQLPDWEETPVGDKLANALAALALVAAPLAGGLLLRHVCGPS